VIQEWLEEIGGKKLAGRPRATAHNHISSPESACVALM
jgi:hypothetical protein